MNQACVAGAVHGGRSAAWTLHQMGHQCEWQPEGNTAEITSITRQKSRRFLHASPQPFETAALHPLWSALYIADEHVHAAADTDGNRNAQRFGVHHVPL